MILPLRFLSIIFVDLIETTFKYFTNLELFKLYPPVITLNKNTKAIKIEEWLRG
jgi:hypothetical protein